MGLYRSGNLPLYVYISSISDTAQLIAGKIASNVKSSNKACLLMVRHTLHIFMVFFSGVFGEISHLKFVIQYLC